MGQSASTESTSTVMSPLPELEGAVREHVNELETDFLEEAEETWGEGTPPFIDNGIPESIEPGHQLEVWKANDMGSQPRMDGPKVLITCRSWKNTGSKYWTCDGVKKDWRHIVGGIGVPNSNGWFVWLVWHGKEHGFTPRRVLWTRLEDQGFTPSVVPLQDGNVAGQTDLNHDMRQSYSTLEAVEKRRGTMFPPSLSTYQSARPTRACTIKQQKEGFYSQPQASSSTEDNDLQDSQPKRLKTGAHPDFRSVQSGEGAANEIDSEEGLFLSQSESGDGIADQAIDSENANGNREFLDLTEEGAGDEEDGEAGLLLTQTESGDSIADQATAIDSETANSAPKFVAPLAVMVPPNASTTAKEDLSKAVAKAKAEAYLEFITSQETTDTERLKETQRLKAKAEKDLEALLQ